MRWSYIPGQQHEECRRAVTIVLLEGYPFQIKRWDLEGRVSRPRHRGARSSVEQRLWLIGNEMEGQPRNESKPFEPNMTSQGFRTSASSALLQKQEAQLRAAWQDQQNS